MYSLLHSGPACCANCKYYRRLDVAEEIDTEIDVDELAEGEELNYGRCVRNPPTFFHPGLLNAEFPVVRATTWCGEFKRDLE